jgi:membrane protein implicated in regulation of membrane protease activity
MTAWVDAVLEWPLSVSVAALVALSVLVSWLATRAVRRVWPHPAFKDNHELVGFTYAVYGLIYGVLPAVTSWSPGSALRKPSNSSCTGRRC